MGEEVKGGASGSEKILSWRFPEGDLWSADRETFARCMGRWFGGGPEIDRETPSASTEWGAPLVGAGHPVR